MSQSRLAAALSLACEAHAGQVRKGSDIPYIAHPMAVAALALEYGGNEDQCAAALLHDAIEDGGEAFAPRIGDTLGTHVLTMVQDCTDGTAESKRSAASAGDAQADWQHRKQAYMAHLQARAAGSPSLLVTACDKLHNARAILSDFRRIGEPLFERFTGKRQGTLWYYGELARILADKQVAPAAALVETVDALRREAGDQSAATHQR